MAEGVRFTSTSPRQAPDDLLEAWFDHVLGVAREEGLTVSEGRPSPDLLRQRLVDAGYTTLPVPEDADGESEGVGAGPGDGDGPPRTGRRRRSNAQKILDIIRGQRT